MRVPEPLGPEKPAKIGHVKHAHTGGRTELAP